MKTKEILFISQRLNNRSSGARTVSEALLETITTAYGKEHIFTYIINKTKKNKLFSFMDKIQGNLDGYSAKDYQAIQQTIIEKSITSVLIDSSYFGKLVEKLRANNANLQIVVFFHDVLVHWWKQYTNVMSIKYYFHFLLYLQSEKKCVNHSNINIVMTDRDRNLLHQIYEGSFDKIFIVPLMLKDSLVAHQSMNTRQYIDKSLLFIGADYKPNIEGLDWYLNNVHARVKTHLYIVGKGLEKYKEKWIRDEVSVIGFVDDLSDWYINCSAVIIPLFSGSGMKVKTAEALCFGKPIFSTDEGLEGYNIDGLSNVFLCNTANSFVEKINAFMQLNNISKTDQQIRGYFLEYHSITAASTKLKEIIGYD